MQSAHRPTLSDSPSRPPLQRPNFTFVNMTGSSPVHERSSFGYIPAHILTERQVGHQDDYPTLSDFHSSQRQYQRQIAKLELQVYVLKSKLRIQKGSHAVSTARIVALEQHLRIATSDIEGLISPDRHESEQHFARRREIAIANTHICRSFLERTSVKNFQTNSYDSSGELSEVDDSFPQEPYAQDVFPSEPPSGWSLLPIPQGSNSEQEQQFTADSSACNINPFKTLISPQSPIPLAHGPSGPLYRPDSPVFPLYGTFAQSSSHSPQSPKHQPSSPTYHYEPYRPVAQPTTSSPVNRPESPVYQPYGPVDQPFRYHLESPKYQPSSQTYQYGPDAPVSQSITSSPVYQPESPIYRPYGPATQPSSYHLESPKYQPSSPNYEYGPRGPVVHPTSTLESPRYQPSSPTYQPGSPIYPRSSSIFHDDAFRKRTKTAIGGTEIGTHPNKRNSAWLGSGGHEHEDKRKRYDLSPISPCKPT